MAHWSWWLSALAMTAVLIVHWLLLRRFMAVSGRVTALVDRLRFGPTQTGQLSPEEALAAMEAETLAEFGEAAIEMAEADSEEPAPAPTTAAEPVPQSSSHHLLFLGGLGLGGMLAVMGSEGWTHDLHSELLPAIIGDSTFVLALVLLASGVLVGFGTRMAGGCTTGHGLCGVSRFQPGSTAATVAYFGVAVLTTLAVGVWL